MEPIVVSAISSVTFSKFKSCLELCKKIYHSARVAKYNEDRCFEIAQRCKLLEKNINQIKKITNNEALDLALELLYIKLKKAETTVEIYSNKGFFGKIKNSNHFEKECKEIFDNINQSSNEINLTIGTDTLKKQDLIIDNQELIIDNQKSVIMTQKL